MVTHSSILACRIPWTEASGRLQPMGSQSWTGLRECQSVVSCSYSKWPQGGSTFPYSFLVSRAAGALGKVCLLGYAFKWNVPEQTPEGLCFTTSAA